MAGASACAPSTSCYSQRDLGRSSPSPALPSLAILAAGGKSTFPPLKTSHQPEHNPPTSSSPYPTNCTIYQAQVPPSCFLLALQVIICIFLVLKVNYIERGILIWEPDAKEEPKRRLWGRWFVESTNHTSLRASAPPSTAEAA
ncbi:hypothetical protein BDQ17DRAFT_1419150 [Cyathus striatus]|nr:hypothetical protein BDQ17DRAFT_1419150 [Cyathus striatus]